MGQGFTGQGVVIGGQDTGYQWDHPALKGKYRGWNGSTASHDYSWHDAIHVAGTTVAARTPPSPATTTGMARIPWGRWWATTARATRSAWRLVRRWIGCRNMDNGWGTPATYIECYEWFIAPTKVDGTAPDPTKAPDVINNSWGCPPSEGCTDPNVLLTVVQTVRAAGIVTVHSAGNSGSNLSPGCSTVRDPAAIYAESYTVGSTDSSDTIAGSSSRGPVTIDGSNRRKPDISAPGVNIRSSVRGGGYGYMSGTSMAGPHVAGAIAVLISAYPGLAGNVDQIENILEQSAVHLTSSQGCGGDSTTAVPNNVYGWGRIDVLAAYNLTCRRSRCVRSPAATGCCIDVLAASTSLLCLTAAAIKRIDAATSQLQLGDPANNHTIVVLSSPRCGAGTAAAAYRTGEFDFELTPGQ